MDQKYSNENACTGDNLTLVDKFAPIFPMLRRNDELFLSTGVCHFALVVFQ